MLRSVSAIVKAAIVVVFIVALVTYASVTRITVYRNTTEIELIKSRFDAYVAVHAAKDDGQDERITALEKTVYVPPGPTVPGTKDPAGRKPAALEQWIVNAADDLRKRVKALEDWRYREER
jgi:hypothetical protein